MNPIEEIKLLRAKRQEDIIQKTFNALIMGEFGTGKSVLLGTARAPVHIDSFDPGGTKSLAKEIESGIIIPDTSYEVADPYSAFSLWENNLLRRKKDGYFDYIGTYALDSYSTWIVALLKAMARKKSRAEDLLQIQDWQIVTNVVRDSVKLMTSLPCDFILTGHIVQEKDELEGRFVSNIAANPALQQQLPILFDEIYCLVATETSKGIDRKIVTSNNGKFKARTRIGRDVFALREDPSIKGMLKKIGFPEERPGLKK